MLHSTEGLQAQSLAVFRAASAQGLAIIPCLNKIDLPHASPEAISQQIEETLRIPPSQHLYISAKSGIGVDKVLGAVIEQLPPPATVGDGWRDRVARLSAGGALNDGAVERWKEEEDDALRALIVDT
jgi:translation elongation factor EF-4